MKAEIELGIIFYPEGLRAEAHPLVEAARRSRRPISTFRPAPSPGVDGYTVLHKAGPDHRVPAAHAHSRQSAVPRVDLSDVRIEREHRVVNCANFNYNWHLVYNYADDVAAARAGRHHPAHHQLARQFGGEQGQPGSEELGRRRPAHDRRDGLRVDRLVRSHRRGIQAGMAGAKGASGVEKEIDCSNSNSASNFAGHQGEP